jgi:erythromycin esterase
MTDPSSSDTAELDPELAAWLAARAVPADAPDDDLEGLTPILGGARVIGLAHTVTGTYDLSALAQRILARLVDHHGVTTLAIDVSASTTTILDDLVRHDRGTTLDVLDRLGAVGWRTREGVAVIDGLRAHNRERPPDQQVRVVGLDPGQPAYSVWLVGTVLRAHAPDALDGVAAPLAGLASGTETPDAVDAADAAEAVVTRLDDPGLDADVEPDQLAAARHHARLVRRSAAYLTAGEDAAAVRERLMAQALTELTGDGSGPPVVLWGHADHVLVGDDPVPTLGHHLRTGLGDGYYALGLLAGAGAFRALRHRRLRGPTRTLTLHRFSPTPGLVSDLTTATAGDHVVDLRAGRADAPAAVTRWWDAARPARVLGEVIAGRADKAPLRSLVPGQAADGWATVSLVRPASPR